MRYDLPRTENDIMEVLWENNREMAPKEILSIFNARGRDWKRQTLNTLLVRLVEKGLISKKRGAVSVLYTREEYKKLQSREFVNSKYGGKLGDFLLSYYGGARISVEQAEEMMQIVENLKEGKII